MLPKVLFIRISKAFAFLSEHYIYGDKYIPYNGRGLRTKSSPRWQHLSHPGDWWHSFICSFQPVLILVLLFTFLWYIVVHYLSCLKCLWIYTHAFFPTYILIYLPAYLPIYLSTYLGRTCLPSYACGTYLHQPGRP